jgi:hypothetical protein
MVLERLLGQVRPAAVRAVGESVNSPAEWGEGLALGV